MGATLSTQPVDEPDLLTLIADTQTPLGKQVADRFYEACRADAAANGGWVSPNRVRAVFVTDGELTVDPRRYSALWSAASSRTGFLDVSRVMEQIEGAGSRGNKNKSLPLRRWRGPVPSKERTP